VMKFEAFSLLPRARAVKGNRSNERWTILFQLITSSSRILPESQATNTLGSFQVWFNKQWVNEIWLEDHGIQREVHARHSVDPCRLLIRPYLRNHQIWSKLRHKPSFNKSADQFRRNQLTITFTSFVLRIMKGLVT
jgi:hypothetical protein